MKITKLALCLAFLFSAAALKAQEEGGDFDGEEMSQQAPRGPMGGQMGPGGQFGGQKMAPGAMQGRPGKNMNQGRPGMGKGWDMPEAMEERVIEVIKRNDPAFAQKLAGLKQTNEKKYDATLAVAAKFLNMGKMADEPGLEKDIVRGISLEYDVRELSLSYEKASDADKAKIKDQMKSKLNELFDIRTKGQEIRVKKLEKEIADLKKGMETRKANKAKIVEQGMEQLIGNKYLSW